MCEPSFPVISGMCCLPLCFFFFFYEVCLLKFFSFFFRYPSNFFTVSWGKYLKNHVIFLFSPWHPHLNCNAYYNFYFCSVGSFFLNFFFIVKRLADVKTLVLHSWPSTAWLRPYLPTRVLGHWHKLGFVFQVPLRYNITMIPSLYI